MIKNRAELIVNRFQIRGRKRFTMPIFQLADLILPANNIPGRDLRELAFAEIGQNFLLNDALFCDPGIEF